MPLLEFASRGAPGFFIYQLSLTGSPRVTLLVVLLSTNLTAVLPPAVYATVPMHIIWWKRISRIDPRFTSQYLGRLDGQHPQSTWAGN